MTAPLQQMSDASRAQARAADPEGSAWVSANAGSGKTRVLTDRVARLLLAGARPEKILCLTYTKAAAAEMQERLFALLGRWAMMEDEALRAELQSRSETALDLSEPVLNAARRLFASALETPGGLKIQTIHAFCESMLRRFPLEAGISPRFEVLDDRTAANLMAGIRDRLAAEAAAGVNPAFDAVAARASEFTADALDGEILNKRDLFEDPQDAAALFELPEGLSTEALWGEAAAALDDGAMEALAEAMAGCGKRAKDKIPLVTAALDAFNAGDAQAAVRRAQGALLKTDGGFFGAVWLFGKNKAEELEELYMSAAEPAFRAAQMGDAIEAMARTADLQLWAGTLLAAYEAEKEALSALDFTDLVARAGRLLTTAEMAAWALFKLDGGVDHILIDEAQDTAPAQWTVIRALAEEFFAGEGARDDGRTLFVVGDEKQSIYSFQGADPSGFGRMRRHFRDRLSAAPRPLHVGELAHSFRSAPAVLALTDKVFEGRAEGLSAEGTDPHHIAFRDDAPGLVELWPFFDKLPEAEDPPWDAPVDAPAPRAPRARLADAVAEHIAELLEEETPIPTRNGGWRAMRPGDVMVLVQRRAGLAPQITRGLKARGVDVAGADRMMLSQELAARDLLALLRVAQDPGDDLSLAALLRSPLGDLSEQGLFDLAHSRRGRLRDALREHRAAAPRAAAMVEAAIALSDFDRPHEILSRALVDHGGRAALLARLGPEAEEPIDELLGQALAYERAETPTLAGFLGWLDGAADAPVKREQGTGADEVRVMTVHGAKGLEAPFVVLPDCGPRKASQRGKSVIGLEGPGGIAPVWKSGGKAAQPSAVQAAMEALEAKEKQESDRLLYVALTRAEERLLIAGAGDSAQKDGSWYGMVEQAMLAMGAAPEAPPRALKDEPSAPGLALRSNWTPGPVAPRLADAAGAGEARGDLQARAAQRAEDLRHPSAPGAAEKRVSASGLGGAHAEPLFGEGRERAEAMARGTLVHAVLEGLADLPGPARQGAIPALLARHGGRMEAGARDACGAEAAAALALPELAPFLGPGAMAEAGLSAALPELGGRLVGRLDRIALLEDRILLLDWKTGRAPDGPEGAPEPYLRQLAGYRAALARLAPGMPVEGYLLWTAVPRLDRISDAALDAAWARACAEA